MDLWARTFHTVVHPRLSTPTSLHGLSPPRHIVPPSLCPVPPSEVLSLVRSFPLLEVFVLSCVGHESEAGRRATP